MADWNEGRRGAYDGDEHEEGYWEEPGDEERYEGEINEEGMYEEPEPATSSNRPPRPRPTAGAATASKAAAAAKAKPPAPYNRGGLTARQRRARLRQFQELRNMARRHFGLPVDEDIPLQQQVNYERMVHDTELMRRRAFHEAEQESVQYRVARHQYSEALVLQAREIMQVPLPFAPRNPEEASAAYAAQQHLAWQLPFNMIQPPRPMWIQHQSAKSKPLFPEPQYPQRPPEPANPPKAKAPAADVGVKMPHPMNPPVALRPPGLAADVQRPPQSINGFLSQAMNMAKPGRDYPLPGPTVPLVPFNAFTRPPMGPPAARPRFTMEVPGRGPEIHTRTYR